MREVLSSGSGCKLISNGVCYGECPWGYRKSLLIGSFEPVCTSACGESEKSFPCGFGCSSGLGSCFDNVRDQVGELTRFVGNVTSFAFGNAIISDVVERVTYVAEFFLQVMPELIAKAKAFWTGVREEEAEVALLIVLLQYIYEFTDNYEDFEILRENIGEVTEFVQSLVRANFKFDQIDLGFIKDRLAQATDKLLQALVTVTQDFLYERCEPAASNVDFSIDDAGAERVMGLWIAKGVENSKPRYELRTDGKIYLEWREDSWQIREPFLVFGKRTLYKAEVDTQTPPTEGWVAVNGDAPVPTLIQLKQQ